MTHLNRFKTKHELEVAVRDGILGGLFKHNQVTDWFTIHTRHPAPETAHDGHIHNYMRELANEQDIHEVYLTDVPRIVAVYDTRKNKMLLSSVHDEALLSAIEQLMAEYRPDINVARKQIDKNTNPVQYKARERFEAEDRPHYESDSYMCVGCETRHAVPPSDIHDYHCEDHDLWYDSLCWMCEESDDDNDEEESDE